MLIKYLCENYVINFFEIDLFDENELFKLFETDLINKDNILFIDPDKNHYNKLDKFYELAEKFKNHLVIDYIDLIINSSKIIICDEKYFNLAIHLNISTPDCIMYSKKNYDISQFINIKPQKIIFITFGGGHENYHNAVKRICHQAKNFNIFYKIYGFTEIDLINDPIFWKDHSNFIVNNMRGIGYWIWKGYLLKKIMDSEDVNDNDIIIYVDCGCELNINGKDKFLEYLELTNTYNNLAFYMDLSEKKYTKMDLFKYMNTSIDDMNSGQIMATCIFLKKTTKNINFLIELNNLYCVNNYHFIDDTQSIEFNDKDFNENRHDQSCYSLLIKKYNMFKIPDETYFDPNWINGIKYPILAFRNKSGDSILEYYFT
jgi:hypothetical protein